jgi:uncharacterized membrane protein
MIQFASYFKHQKTKEYSILFLILLTFFVVFTTVSLHRYWQYAAWYYDFGIFYSAISSVALGKEPIIDHFVFTDKNILGDHFHPIIFLVSPFVAIFKRGETLLVFQTFFATLSGIFVYLTAKEILKNKLEAFSMLIIYFSYIGLHNALITEFHAIALLPLPLMIFFYGMVKQYRWWFVIGLVGVLLTKESTFIITAWFGVVMFFKNKGEWRNVGIYATALSIGYGFTLLYYVFPAINGEGYYYANEALKGSASLTMLSDLKLQTIFKTLLSFGFLPLLAPELLPPILFNWWSRFTSLATTRFTLGMHYNAEITPTLILASIYGWDRFKKYSFTKIENKHFSYLLFSIAICALVYSTQILKSPALLFTNKAFYAHTQNLEFLNELVRNIPEDGIVMAQTNIAAKLAYRKVYMLRANYSEFSPDYIVIDSRDGQESNNWYGISSDGIDALHKNLADDDSYDLYYEQGDQRIYKKVVR